MAYISTSPFDSWRVAAGKRLPHRLRAENARAAKVLQPAGKTFRGACRQLIDQNRQRAAERLDAPAIARRAARIGAELEHRVSHVHRAEQARAPPARGRQSPASSPPARQDCPRRSITNPSASRNVSMAAANGAPTAIIQTLKRMTPDSLAGWRPRFAHLGLHAQRRQVAELDDVAGLARANDVNLAAVPPSDVTHDQPRRRSLRPMKRAGCSPPGVETSGTLVRAAGLRDRIARRRCSRRRHPLARCVRVPDRRRV